MYHEFQEFRDLHKTEILNNTRDRHNFEIDIDIFDVFDLLGQYVMYSVYEINNIPQWISQFEDNKDFEFHPICIDITSSELKQYFESEKNKKWDYLSDMTYIDIDRKSNSIFAVSGHLPLNLVIGKGGIVRYIRIGKIEGERQIQELKEAIDLGLKN